jgi:uncharacterized membrane protein
LSDGVFAFAITLLVLNFDAPAAPETTTITARMVVRLWPDLFSYVISFLVIGNFWVDHRHIFRHVRRHTPRVTWINLLLLMSVAFLPYPTSLLGDFGGRIPVALYAASMATTGSLEYWLWRHVSSRDALLVEGVDERLVRFDRAQYLAAPLVFALSIPVALFVAVDLALALWGTLFILLPLLKRRYGVSGYE